MHGIQSARTLVCLKNTKHESAPKPLDHNNITILVHLEGQISSLHLLIMPLFIRVLNVNKYNNNYLHNLTPIISCNWHYWGPFSKWRNNLRRLGYNYYFSASSTIAQI